MDKKRRTLTGILILLPCLWAGILVGASFLATTAKFWAPSLELPVALDVGRQTFAWMAYTDWGLVVLLALFAALGPFSVSQRNLVLKLLGPTALLILLQAVWLRPALDARVQVFMDGGIPEPSHLHLVFVTFESAKVLMLLWLAYKLVSQALPNEDASAA
jgi:hypothetical protein